MEIETFLSMHGISYIVSRQGEPQRTELGLPNKGYIAFRPGTDIKKSDVLTNPVGETYYVTKTETEFFYHEPSCLKVFYQTESEYDEAQQPSSPIFNIQNAYGSVIGTGNQATINYNSAISELKERASADTSPDKAQISQIISLLEMMVNDQVPPSKGLFSKFSEVLERHSWLSSSVASMLLSWLMSKIQ